MKGAPWDPGRPATNTLGQWDCGDRNGGRGWWMTPQMRSEDGWWEAWDSIFRWIIRQQVRFGQRAHWCKDGIHEEEQKRYLLSSKGSTPTITWSETRPASNQVDYVRAHETRASEVVWTGHPREVKEKNRIRGV